MELLIPGLILVALMAWASTRIKKTAAAAYDAENIETDEFIIQKPDEFLHNLNGDPKYIFEAYSKEFSKANDKVRMGTATITCIRNGSIDQVIRECGQTGDLQDDGPLTLGGITYRMFVRDTDDAETSYKFAEKNGSVYKLEIVAAKEAAEGQWVEIFVDSFQVK